MTAKIVIDTKKCKGCELCVVYCPEKAIRLSRDFNSAGYHPAEFIAEARCNGCGYCYIICPETAIEVYKGTERSEE